MPTCDACGDDYPENKGMAASNDSQTIWLCATCVFKQSNGKQVGEDT